MTPAEGIELLADLIALGEPHEHYQRTVDVAIFGRRMATGKGHEDWVKAIRPREKDEEKEQRFNLYNPITPLAIAPVVATFDQVSRTNQYIFDYTSNDDGRRDTLAGKLKRFYREGTFREYLIDQAKYLTFYDPNAKVIIERNNVTGPEGDVQDVEVFPMVAYSENVYAYERKNGNLEWVALFYPFQVKVREETKTFYDFWLYAGGTTVHFHEYDGADMPEGFEGYDPIEVMVDDDESRFFLYQAPENGTTEVPALEVGAYRDPETYGETFITPQHFAEHLLFDLIRDKSFLDLNKTLHTFPQKYVYGRECRHEKYIGDTKYRCYGGYYEGTTNRCDHCKGSGVDTHTTEQEVIQLIMPDPDDPSALIELQKLAHYVELNLDLPKWQAEQLEVWTSKIYFAVFVDDKFEVSTVAKTATELLLTREEVQNKLTPFGKALDVAIEKGVRVIDQYLHGDSHALTVNHTFLPDFKLKSAPELAELYKAVKDAGFGPSVTRAVERDMLEVLYKNNPTEVNVLNAFSKFYPFQNLPTEILPMVLAGRAPTDRDRVLFENWSRIVMEIRRETNDTFHLTEYAGQVAILEEKVRQLSGEIEYYTAPALNLPIMG